MYRTRYFQKDQMPVDEFSTDIFWEGIVVVQSIFTLLLIRRSSIGYGCLSDSIDTGIHVSKKDIIQCFQSCKIA